MSVWRGEARGGQGKRENVRTWGRPPPAPGPWNPAFLYLGHFGSFFSLLRLSLVICTMGINKAATEDSHKGRGRWNMLGLCEFLFCVSFPNQILAPGVFVHTRLHGSNAHACTLAQKGFAELWLLSGFRSGSMTSCVVGGKFLSLAVPQVPHL